MEDGYPCMGSHLPYDHLFVRCIRKALGGDHTHAAENAGGDAHRRAAHGVLHYAIASAGAEQLAEPIKLFYFIMHYLFIILFTFTMASTGYSQKFFNPEPLFDPSPYGFSHVAVVPAGSRFVFVAGQGGEENSEGKLSPDFRTQVQHALKNIEIALHLQGLSMGTVAKVTTLVVDHNDQKLRIIIQEFEKMWPAKNFPVNTLIPVPRLALDNMLVEIDATAVAN